MEAPHEGIKAWLQNENEFPLVRYRHDENRAGSLNLETGGGIRP